jgi:hypothetical protein
MTKPIKGTSLAAMFFNAAKPKAETFSLLGVGQVDIVELTEGEVSEVRKSIDSEKDVALRGKLFGYGLVVKSTKKDGEPIFTAQDIPLFSGAANAAVESLAAAVLKINGYGVELGN